MSYVVDDAVVDDAGVKAGTCCREWTRSAHGEESRAVSSTTANDNKASSVGTMTPRVMHFGAILLGYHMRVRCARRVVFRKTSRPISQWLKWDAFFVYGSVGCHGSFASMYNPSLRTLGQGLYVFCAVIKVVVASAGGRVFT